jgi:DNA helicase-2/ATP-dependent DNA helicase PcrA
MGVQAREIAILYRTNIQSRAMIDGLVKRELPFALHDADGEFYRRWQVRDVLAYLRLALDPDDLDGLVQIVNRPKRYLHPERWVDEVHAIRRERGVSYVDALRYLEGLEPYQKQKAEQLGADLRRLRGQSPVAALKTIRYEIGYERYLEDYATKTGNDLKLVTEPLDELEQAVVGHGSLTEFLAHVQEVEETVRRSRKTEDGIQLMTMHRAKGLEFERVYCIGLVEDMLPHPKALAADGEKKAAALEEERRLLYVGMTRAKRFLTLSAPLKYHGRRVQPSPFLYETGLLERPKRVAIGGEDKRGGLAERLRVGVTRIVGGGGTGRRGAASVAGQTAATNPAMQMPASERMKAALEQYGGLEVRVGDRLEHREMGLGTIEAIKPVSGGGRRVVLRFADQEKTYDLHLELCLYLGLMSARR